MKKFLLFALLLFALDAAAQTTPNLQLNTPQFGTPNWNTFLNNNFNMLDSYLSGILPLPLNLTINGNLTVLGTCTGCGGGGSSPGGTGNAPFLVNGLSLIALTPQPYCAANMMAYGNAPYVCLLQSGALNFYGNPPSGLGQTFAYLNVPQAYTAFMNFNGGLAASSIGVGPVVPTACGTALGCIALNTSSSGSVNPLVGQNTIRFSTTQILCTINGGSESQCLGGSGSGGGNPTLDNCTPDESGNSFYSVTALTNYFYASWQFVFNTSTYINCTVYIPTAATGATIVLDIAANDNTAGHTASFQTCDEAINTGTINIGSALTCAAAQTFTTTSTAYSRTSLTFNVQSTLSNGSILIVKILTSTSGTAPTANLLVNPHIVL